MDIATGIGIGMVVMWAVALFYIFKGIVRRAERHTKLGETLRSKGIAIREGGGVADVMRDYPYQNVVYGTAASEIMELRNQKKD